MKRRWTLHDLANWWRRRCDQKQLNGAYPKLSYLNLLIVEARRRHEPIAHLYAARQQFIHRELGL